MLVETVATVSTLALTHVTYLNTYRDKDAAEWPHRKALTAATRATVSTATTTVRVLTHVIIRVRHHGRVVVWNVWVIARLPVRRVPAEREDD